MKIILADIPIEKLVYGVNRSKTWIDEHPNFSSMQEKLIKDIKKRGVKYPLCCSNIKDDGTYVVNVGNQRLQALTTMGAKTARCLVACTDTQKNIPNGKIISKKDIRKLFNGKIKNMCLAQSNFFVVSGEASKWDFTKMGEKNV